VKRSSRGHLWALLALLGVGCPGAPISEAELNATLDRVTAPRLERFASSDAFDRYREEIDRLRPRGWGGLFGCASPREAGAPADTEITNNQEAGVDEGDIVKATATHLVVLRRGRLFSVQHAGALRAVSQIDASPPGFGGAAWYDELLVRGDQVVVIGYSYAVSATELGLFCISPEGVLSHQATYFLSSNDYYSSRNYASRLVGDRLIFYLPYFLDARGSEAELPSLRRWVKGDQLGDWSEVLSKVEIYRPIQRAAHPALHTVVQCDLGAAELSCSARAVVAPASRSFYVSDEAVYLWASEESRARSTQRPGALYRLPLDGGEITAARVQGAPIDQFSFHRAADGTLEVVALHSGSGGDSMWNPQAAAGPLSLVKISPLLLSAEAPSIPTSAYAPLPPFGDNYGVQNRFAGEHLLLGASGTRALLAVPTGRPGGAVTLNLPHDVERLEPLGRGAAVVGMRGDDLMVSTLSLEGAPAVVSSHTLTGASQAESRSHGFFFRPDGGGGGLMGLPVHSDSAPSRHRRASAQVAFLRVDAQLGLSPFGALGSSEASDELDDGCKVSCTDWYGNARPIFLGERILALLGYELVEGEPSATGVVERSRLHFLRPAD
jgi:hypothetical protein